MQVKRRRRDRRPAQHHVNLSAMVCFVIEEMAEGHGHGLYITPAPIVDVGERLSDKIGFTRDDI